MRFQCLIIILVLTNYLVQSYYTPNQSDFTNVEEMLKNILNKYITPLQKHVGQLINQSTNRVLPTPAPGPPPSKCLCGRAKASSRILNGKTAEKNEFPWQVGLTTGRAENIFCGGSIVSSKSIVTAASCLREKDMSRGLIVVVADHDLNHDDGEKYYKVCGRVMHPSYRQDIHDYNYAVLTLCKALIWGPSVSPVCLPSILVKGSYFEHKKAIVSGWGSTSELIRETLKKVTVRTITKDECCKNRLFNCDEVTERTICAAAGKNGEKGGPCVGDDGGPLVVQNPKLGAYVLVGIVSKQESGCNWGVYAEYARVTDQLKWLQSKITGTNCSKK